MLRTPLKNRGNVVLDVCTSDGARDTLTLSRALLKRDGTSTFKDARKLTAGSLLRYECGG